MSAAVLPSGPFLVRLATDGRGSFWSRRFPAADLAEAQRVFRLACSGFPGRPALAGYSLVSAHHAVVLDAANGAEVAQISGNGRVWPAGGWRGVAAPLLEADGSPGRR